MWDMKISEVTKYVLDCLSSETISRWIRKGFLQPAKSRRAPTKEGHDLNIADITLACFFHAYRVAGGNFRVREEEHRADGFIQIEPLFWYDQGELSTEQRTRLDKSRIRGREFQTYTELLNFHVFVLYRPPPKWPGDKPEDKWFLRVYPTSKIHKVLEAVTASRLPMPVTCFHIRGYYEYVCEKMEHAGLH